MGFSKVETGKRGEVEVQRYLMDKGYTILETNFRKRFGEIDIIAMINNTVAFIEVRSKTSINFGTAAESITYGKKQKIMKVAQYFIAKQKKDLSYRFDVITVFINSQSISIDHYENAF